MYRDMKTIDIQLYTVYEKETELKFEEKHFYSVDESWHAFFVGMHTDTYHSPILPQCLMLL